MFKLKAFVGWDSREEMAYNVCHSSINRHSHGRVPVYPLKQNSLRESGIYTREVDQKATTEFTITRFLTPYLARQTGWSVFMDCDFLLTCDITDVLQEVSEDRAVYVVKHDYSPAQMIKMDQKRQSVYPRKNWSSFIVFNNAHPKVKALTPEVVNSESPAFLHRFSWLEDDDIGELDLKWNFLVGEYNPLGTVPNCIHFTNGGPWFENCKDVDYADLWLKERGLLDLNAA